MSRKVAALAAVALLLFAAAASPALADRDHDDDDDNDSSNPMIVGYIPPSSQGCPPNVKVHLSAKAECGGLFSPPTVSGQVAVSNGEDYDVPVTAVQIFVYPSNSPVAPVTSSCAIGTVPWNPTPYAVNTRSCYYTADLPTSGPSAGANNWSSAMAVVVLPGGTKCYSDMINVSSPYILGGSSSSGGGGRKMLGVVAGAAAVRRQ